MKKLLLYISILCVGIILGLYLAPESSSSDFIPDVSQSVVEPVIKPRPFDVCVSDGTSMNPTMYKGECFYLEKREPVAGDIVSFDCLKGFCGTLKENGNDTIGSIKRLKDIRTTEAGKKCYHLLGDNQEESWDSQDYGCIPEDKISIDGVVILDK